MAETTGGPILIDEWQIDYLDGRRPRSIQVPHSWNLEKSVEEEGPVLYKTFIEKPVEECWLVFRGVSYAAKVKVDGELTCEHKGIWDAFAVPLRGKASHCTVEVEVVKNGGQTYPVPQTLSGFLPYVYQTFGGIFREVELYPQKTNPLLDEKEHNPSKIVVKGSQIWIEDKPFYMRAALHWGWYPRLGRPNPTIETVRSEIESLKQLGFNSVKFCLWLPPHYYLDLLREVGMQAWIELPLWLPKLSPAHEEEALAEIEKIVRQYRHHPNIIAWTCGCELGHHVGSMFRKRLFNLVFGLTSCPLVRDDSGGSEMYGGDPTEFATFDDFHPYADLHLLPELYQTLRGPTELNRPMLMGEFCDYDTHRDLARLQDEHPYWASILPEYNAQGVRWAYDLPKVMGSSDFAHEHRESGHHQLYDSSRIKNGFIRKLGIGGLRQFDGISGYVVTGIADTPVSSSGMFDDWGEPKLSKQQALEWNGDVCVFLLSRRSTPFLFGSNLTGKLDPFTHFVGHREHVLGVHSSITAQLNGLWKLSKDGVVLAHDMIPSTQVEAFQSKVLLKIPMTYEEPGQYTLEIEFGPTKYSAPMTIASKAPLDNPLTVWADEDELWRLEGSEDFNILPQPMPSSLPSKPGVLLLSSKGTCKVPFWRTCAFQYPTSLLNSIGLEDNYYRLLPLSPSTAIDQDWLSSFAGSSPIELHMNRIDTLTYAENPLLAGIGSHLFATVLRPQGGVGSDPVLLRLNPSGIQFLRDLSAKLGQF